VKDRSASRSLPRRLLTWYALTLLGVLALLGVAIARDRLTGVRLLVALSALGAALVGLAALYAVTRGLTHGLRGMSDSIADMAEGGTHVPVHLGGPAELALLADSLNRMSERLRASVQETRQASETRDLILLAMEEGVVLVEGDGSVRYANPAASALVARKASDLRAFPAAVRGLVTDVRASGALQEGEFEAGFPPRVLRSSAVPVSGGRVLLVLRDVTEARGVEAMRRDFVANTSHELKTPVASIQAAAETIRDAARDDPRAAGRFAEQLHRDALRLSRIVSDLLDLSRLEAERPRLSPVRLDRLTSEEMDRIMDHAGRAGVNLEFRSDPAIVHGSQGDLALLVRNLLDNAVRYSPDGGRVEVEVASSDGEALLAVRDTGIGIPSRDLPRIFERFYRVDRARSRETGGTGLGLSIAKHVAEQHGGRIEVDSELGRGSEFRVRLPASSVPERSERRPA
jgi:two-component system phosphate regulon sensor histidine kinase PhoR